METILKRKMFCEKCLFQFDEMIVFNMHQADMHKIEVNMKLGNGEIPIANQEDYESRVVETKIFDRNRNDSEKHNFNRQKTGRFICSICDEVLKSKDALRKHVDGVHGGKKAQYGHSEF